MKLICMSFDGEYQVERPTFKTVEGAWEYANELGSKWFFYPFHFVVTDSLLTVKGAPNPWLTHLQGKRLKTVVALFAKVAKDPAAQNADCDAFINLL